MNWQIDGQSPNEPPLQFQQALRGAHVELFDFAFQENPDYFLSNPIFRLRYDFLLNKNNDKKSILNVQDRVSMWSHLNKN